MSKDLTLPIQEPRLDTSTIVKQKIQEQGTNENADMGNTGESISPSALAIESNQEPSNVTQNAPEDAGDFWRSRPHRPITRR